MALNPTQHPMHRGMHPHLHARTVIEPLIAADAAAQQLTQQHLLRKGPHLQLRI